MTALILPALAVAVLAWDTWARRGEQR